MFSMLDIKSLMRAMACCTMFRKYAMEPTSYSHINLTTAGKSINDGIVCTMIHRAGKQLRFLEVGDVEPPKKPIQRLLKGGVCLQPLSFNDGFIGKCLRKIHLYDIIYKHEMAPIADLSACSNMTDLKIVGSFPPEELLESLTNCRLIEQLFLETYSFYSEISKSSALVAFLTNLPNLTSLSLRGITLDDEPVRTLVEAAHKLKYMDLSRNPAIKGRFLRKWGNLKGNSLETLILRDCEILNEKEVVKFLNSLSRGNFRFIRHIDISSKRGLLDDSGKRSYQPKFPLEMLKKERPDVKLLANFGKLSREEKLSRGIKSSGDSSSDDSSSDGSSSESDDSD